MRYPLSIGLFCVAIASSGLVQASDDHKGMNPDEMKGMKNLYLPFHKGHGKVDSINMEKARINLAHGPIPTLGWPAMTMGFSVKDKTILDQVKVGDMIDFELVYDGPGEYHITKITTAK